MKKFIILQVILSVSILLLTACVEKKTVAYSSGGGYFTEFGENYDPDGYYGKNGRYNWDSDSQKSNSVPRKPADFEKCSVQDMSIYLLDLMWKYYLWYDKIPDNLNFLNYQTLDECYQAIMYKESDHFSYIAKKADHDDYYNGKYYGFGYGTSRKDDNKSLYIDMVYPDSPADKAGMKRGQKILKINGKTIEEIDAEPDGWTNAYGLNEQGVEVKYVLQNRDESIIEVSVYRDEVYMKSVLKTAVIEHNGQKTGYIHFKMFINPSNDELDASFKTFKEAGITDLVLDMRYNGGGLLDTAAHLGSLIAGDIAAGRVFTRLSFNDKQQQNNSDYIFKKLENTVGIKNLMVITTRGTASASESVINGLAPFINVKIIGQTTYGKPVGMNSFDLCNYTIVPITFKLVNADGYGDYYEGMPADCLAEDDVLHDFGDPEETSLKEALYVLENGKCSQDSTKLSPYIMNLRPKEIPLKGLYQITGTF